MKALAFEQRLSIGQEFEQAASRFLTNQGFPIRLNLSAERQWEFGESAAHVEIKNDRLFLQTRNLFIEIRERRSDDGSSRWREAGIYDASDPWLYLIGDYTRLWLLPTLWLQKMHATGKYVEKSIETSVGFLIPVGLADRIAVRSWSDWREQSPGNHGRQ